MKGPPDAPAAMPPRRPPIARSTHRALAVDCFNQAWTLLMKKRRTKAEDLDMIHRAHASRYHWGIVGTPTNWAIGEWQVSHVYAVLRRPEPARFHAKACLRICREHGVGDFPLAYAYEALARATALSGPKKEAMRYLRQAIHAGARIREKEDREQFARDLKTIPSIRASH